MWQWLAVAMKSAWLGLWHQAIISGWQYKAKANEIYSCPGYGFEMCQQL